MVQGEQMGWEYLEKGDYYLLSLWDWSEGKTLSGYEQIPVVFCTKVNGVPSQTAGTSQRDTV